MTPRELYTRALKLRLEGEEMRREAVRRALVEAGGNQVRAAAILGIKRNALVALLRRDPRLKEGAR